ncbi:DUF1648 domain-containing protein [Weeksellaceae bacterium A-14]
MALAANILRFISILVLVALWVYTGVRFPSLPQEIPVHFDFHGNPDNYGSRNMIWIEPVVATLLFLLLQYVSKNVQSPLLNIPQSLRENKWLAEVFVMGMSVVVSVLFLVIGYGSIQVSSGQSATLSYLPLILVGLMFVYMLVFFAVASRLKNKENS